ncbi:MAG: hypothetical protein WC810_28195 [Janthinobacterium sp.]|jgi:F0F1-type ATP synthase delta subunit
MGIDVTNPVKTGAEIVREFDPANEQDNDYRNLIEMIDSNTALAVAEATKDLEECFTDHNRVINHLTNELVTAQQQILQQQAVIDNICVQFSIMPYNKDAYTQALQQHVNAEKVKMLEEVLDRFSHITHGHTGMIKVMIAELTKPTGEE